MLIVINKLLAKPRKLFLIVKPHSKPKRHALNTCKTRTFMFINSTAINFCDYLKTDDSLRKLYLVVIGIIVENIKSVG